MPNHSVKWTAAGRSRQPDTHCGSVHLPQALGLQKEDEMANSLNAKRSGYLFIAAGCMFFIAAYLGKQLAFCGVGVAFIGIGASFVVRTRRA